MSPDAPPRTAPATTQAKPAAKPAPPRPAPNGSGPATRAPPGTQPKAGAPSAAPAAPAAPGAPPIFGGGRGAAKVQPGLRPPAPQGQGPPGGGLRSLGGVTRLPNFPAPAGPRPDPVTREEQRRVKVAQDEARRRAEVLQTARPEERLRLQREWDEDDKLFYAFDPDDVEVELYPVREPFAYVQVLRNRRTHDVTYHAIEPKLTHRETRILQFVEGTLVDVLEIQPDEIAHLETDKYIRDKFDQVLADYGIDLADSPADREDTRSRLLYYVLRDFTGEGPIDVFLRDPWIEDISCDGPHQPLFVYHRRHESMTSTVRFRDDDHLDSFVIRLAQRAGKHVSIAEPILDATMRDGSRLQATLAKEVSSFGSTFTIRKFKEVPFTPLDLIRFGTMSPQMLAYFWLCVQHHMSMIFAGGTASGKTTSINAVMLFIPAQHKVVSIEDTREIKIPQPNWIAGVTRSGFGPRDNFGRQAGEIDMYQLLKNALRQRPEYIIVGEVRGEEAYNLFQAMATGHAAYGTLHADSVDAVIHRLESEPLKIPRPLLEALDVVSVQVQTRVGGKRVRRTKQITEIVGLDPNTREILTNEVFRWVPATDTYEYSGVSYALERIAAESGLTTPQIVQELQDRIKVLQTLAAQDVRDYEKVANVIASYYKDKAKLMAALEAGRSWP